MSLVLSVFQSDIFIVVLSGLFSKYAAKGPHGSPKNDSFHARDLPFPGAVFQMKHVKLQGCTCTPGT